MKSLKWGLSVGIVVILAFLYGCSSGISQKVTSCYYPDSPSDSAPLWICGAPVSGVKIAGVGASTTTKGSYNLMIQQASANARVVLAQQIKTDIEAIVENKAQSKVSNDDINIVEELNSASKSITAQSLRGTKIFKQVVSPNGFLYVLVGYDPSYYRKVISGLVSEGVFTEIESEV